MLSALLVLVVGAQIGGGARPPPRAALLKDLRPGPLGSDPAICLVWKDALYFTAEDDGGRHPWRGDGTLEGTQRIKDLRSDGRTKVFAGGFVSIGQRLLFSAHNGPHDELWTTDGTSGGTEPLRFSTPERPGGVMGIAPGDGVAVFLFQEPVQPTSSTPDAEPVPPSQDSNAEEESPPEVEVPKTRSSLWRTDGTPAGTKPLLDLGLDSPNEIYSLTLAGRTLFAVRSGLQDVLLRFDETARELEAIFEADGAVAGASVNVSVLRSPGGPDDPLYFTTLSPPALWRTRAPASVRPGGPGENVRVANVNACDLIRFRGALYAVGYTRDAIGLWRTDGTARGTKQVRRLGGDPPFPGEVPAGKRSRGGVCGFTPVPDGLLVRVPGYQGTELWRTDGTPKGTVKLSDDADVVSAATLGGETYVSASTGTGPGTRYSLWRVVGEPPRRVKVEDVPTTRAFLGRCLKPLGDALLFEADDGVHGVELWRLGPAAPRQR